MDNVSRGVRHFCGATQLRSTIQLGRDRSWGTPAGVRCGWGHACRPSWVDGVRWCAVVPPKQSRPPTRKSSAWPSLAALANPIYLLLSMTGMLLPHMSSRPAGHGRCWPLLFSEKGSKPVFLCITKLIPRRGRISLLPPVVVSLARGAWDAVGSRTPFHECKHQTASQPEGDGLVSGALHWPRRSNTLYRNACRTAGLHLFSALPVRGCACQDYESGGGGCLTGVALLRVKYHCSAPSPCLCGAK
jgi:hypothetical protein